MSEMYLDLSPLAFGVRDGILEDYFVWQHSLSNNQPFMML
jgi:hypothetical protein